ncbi:hypothetical protein SCALM49S_08956 [Streptomyces californicus]
MQTAQTVTSGDPRLSWSTTETSRAPRLIHRRDGILPAVAAALSVRGETLTCTAGKGDQHLALHPLVQDFLDTPPSTGANASPAAAPKPYCSPASSPPPRADAPNAPSANPSPTAKPAAPSNTPASPPAASARTATPLHGSYAPPCRSCSALLSHFGVRPVDLTATGTATSAEKG